MTGVQTCAFRSLTDTRVDLIDIDTSKAAVLALLNSTNGIELPIAPLKTWKVSPRGALIETTPGE